jgi:hypothetical protein
MIQYRRTATSATVAVALALCAVHAVHAADSSPAGQSLEQAASDPTASLLSVSVQNIFAGSFHRLDAESGNTLLLRASMPFETGSLKHIARASLPVVTDSPSGETGLSDAVLFDLIVFEESWGRWGIGPVLLVPTATDDAIGAGKWAAGPALGFVARNSRLMWGLFNQNLFSFAGGGDRTDISASILQPIVNYSLPERWSIGTSEMNVTYDWNRDAWATLPVGMKLARMVKFGKRPIQFAGAYEYNFADDDVAPKWTLSFTVKFLLAI